MSRESFIKTILETLLRQKVCKHILSQNVWIQSSPNPSYAKWNHLGWKKIHKRKCQSLYRKHVLDYKMHCERLFSVLFAIQILFSILKLCCLKSTYCVFNKLKQKLFQYFSDVPRIFKYPWSKQTHQNVSSTCCTGDKNASLKKFIQIFLGTKQFQN